MAEVLVGGTSEESMLSAEPVQNESKVLYTDWCMKRGQWKYGQISLEKTSGTSKIFDILSGHIQCCFKKALLVQSQQ